ncbi:head-tail connector protein [Cochlodiniinecator piscidefendens]|uniref:head-tail connector protein n=1 Tax=Cochlodiniinecator piscidefendens TaxID=2715756 RepID=UPI00140D299C|nr:head-tail connector protein [Cochlodiniinecator piscidefendens]
MMLIEQATVPSVALPIAVFKDHLRLSHGFADDGFQDALLEQVLRAAMAAVEARTGKVLIQRGFTWSLTGWRTSGVQALPVAPVQSITAMRLFDRMDAETIVDDGTYSLEKDNQRPKVRATGTMLPRIPVGGQAEVEFEAGFGPNWTDVPADLGMAVLLLATHYYENRSATSDTDNAMPFGVTELIARYRTVRILGGSAL